VNIERVEVFGYDLTYVHGRFVMSTGREVESLPTKLIRDLAVALGLRLTIEDTWGGDVITAAVSHLAASTPPETLFTVSFMNEWTHEHIGGYQPRPQLGVGSAPIGAGLGIEVDPQMLGAPLFAVG